MGNHEKMVRRSIDLLERNIVLLTEEVVDDVHLSSSTARMIDAILQKVKQTLIRVQKPANTSTAPSRDHSRPSSPQPNVNESSNSFFDPNAHQFATHLPASSEAFAISDPLAGIEARPMADLMDRTFIPPPNFNFQTNDFDTGFMDDPAVDHSVTSDNNQTDWLAMPLEALLNKGGYRVEQGFHSIGPMVGQHDMLEVLTNQNYDHMLWNGQHNNFQDYRSG